MPDRTVIQKIISQLAGIDYEDLSTAEQNIVDILIQADFVQISDFGEVERV
jgi:hypothetical protein